MDVQQELKQAAALARRGDLRAYHILFQRTCQGAMALASCLLPVRQEALALLEEVYALAFGRLDKLPEATSFDRWLCAILINEGSRRLAAGGRERLVECPPLVEAPCPRRIPRSYIEEPPLRRQLHYRLEALPRTQRMILVLCHRIGYTPGEAAWVLQTSTESVHGGLSLAWDALARDARWDSPLNQGSAAPLGEVLSLLFRDREPVDTLTPGERGQILASATLLAKKAARKNRDRLSLGGRCALAAATAALLLSLYSGISPWLPSGGDGGHGSTGLAADTQEGGTGDVDV